MNLNSNTHTKPQATAKGNEAPSAGTPTNPDQKTQLTAKAETQIWGAPQHTIEEMSKLSPQELDKAHKAGQLKAIIDGDNQKLLEVRNDPEAAAVVDVEATTDEDAESQTDEETADDWHAQMKDRYGVEQLTLAEMQTLAETDAEDLRKRIDEGQTQAVARGDHGPTTTTDKTTAKD